MKNLKWIALVCFLIAAFEYYNTSYLLEKVVKKYNAGEQVQEIHRTLFRTIELNSKKAN